MRICASFGHAAVFIWRDAQRPAAQWRVPNPSNAMSQLMRTLVQTIGVVIPGFIGLDWLAVRAGLFPEIPWRAIGFGAVIFAVGSHWSAQRRAA